MLDYWLEGSNFTSFVELPSRPILEHCDEELRTRRKKHGTNHWHRWLVFGVLCSTGYFRWFIIIAAIYESGVYIYAHIVPIFLHMYISHMHIFTLIHVYHFYLYIICIMFFFTCIYISYIYIYMYIRPSYVNKFIYTHIFPFCTNIYMIHNIYIYNLS